MNHDIETKAQNPTDAKQSNLRVIIILISFVLLFVGLIAFEIYSKK